VAGHRRYTAVKILKWPTIPATVRANLDEKKARILNLVENFQRQDLNILQEAEALKHLCEAGVPRETVAREIGMSGGWVQVRYNLLRLPPEIQQEAAAGMINQYHIKTLCTLRTKEDQFEAVRKIKEAKLKGDKPPAIGIRKKKTADIKKARQPNELFDMIEILAQTALGYGIHTRVLAWAAGEITSAELFVDIKRADPTFFPPTEF
jgi:ParB family chromosome partitioning protein